MTSLKQKAQRINLDIKEEEYVESEHSSPRHSPRHKYQGFPAYPPHNDNNSDNNDDTDEEIDEYEIRPSMQKKLDSLKFRGSKIFEKNYNFFFLFWFMIKKLVNIFEKNAKKRIKLFVFLKI